MLFLWNILLALVWCLLQGALDSPTLAMGFILGFLVLRISAGSPPVSPYFAKPRRFAAFLLYFLREMHLALFRVALDVVTLRHRSNPGIIGFPLEARTEPEIAFLACILSLTPGTMVLDLSPDRRVLYLHVMFIPDGGPEALNRQIRTRLETPMLKIMR